MLRSTYDNLSELSGNQKLNERWEYVSRWVDKEQLRTWNCTMFGEQLEIRREADYYDCYVNGNLIGGSDNWTDATLECYAAIGMGLNNPLSLETDR
jgi:hypothetical protein